MSVGVRPKRPGSVASGPTRYTRVRLEFVYVAEEPHEGINPELLDGLANRQGAAWVLVETGLKALGLTKGHVASVSREFAAVVGDDRYVDGGILKSGRRSVAMYGKRRPSPANAKRAAR